MNSIRKTFCVFVLLLCASLTTFASQTSVEKDTLVFGQKIQLPRSRFGTNRHPFARSWWFRAGVATKHRTIG